MLIVKLAFRNILGAGLRTWLNVFVLSMAFVAIIWIQGLINGQQRQVISNMIDSELGGGQYWYKTYDPYDPFTVEESHGSLTPKVAELVSSGQATAILITSGAIYPQGRVQTALIKGIDPAQEIVSIPAWDLKSDDPYIIPALIGTRMAKQTSLKKGDLVTARWRDINGTFDAADLEIVQIMDTHAPAIDSGQVWIPLDKMQEMLQAPGEATLIIMDRDMTSMPPGDEVWIKKDLDFLLKDIMEMIKMKSSSSAILYGLLLAMALLAIFDTQVLAIFRRRKEMGTLMALGMPRSGVIGLFTLEGALHGILALFVGMIYGAPIMYLTAAKGLTFPKEAVDSTGMAMSNVLYPSYSLNLVIGTTLLVFVTVTIVSFMPARKIVKLKPTDALRGKLS